MDLLLQAAKVLELENSGDGADRVSSKSTRGTHFHQYAKSKGENSENSDGSLSYSENGVGANDEDSLVERASRRIGGAGTREVHNQLEKNRRKQLRECFNHLQQCVPSLENKRVATQSILQGAIKHIKNLKKKDVEQEREIQMLAKRKSELKKKYDVEFNKCSEEQQKLAEVFLKVKTETQEVRMEEDGHTSDSTTTASEGPNNEEDFSDEERETMQAVKSSTSPLKAEGSRKRKLGPRATLGFGGRISDPTSSSPNSTHFTHHLNAKAVSSTSSVSSSSVALKHMLEQRKKNQTLTAHATSSSSPDQSQLKPITPTTRVPGKSASSLTSSYPMISTHLASAIKPPVSASAHAIITQATQVIAQPSGAALASANISSNSSTISRSPVSKLSNTAVSPTTLIRAPTSPASSPPAIPSKGKKLNDGSSKGGNASSPQRTIPMYLSSPSTQVLNSVASQLPPKSPIKLQPGTAVIPSVTLVRPPNIIAVKTPDAKKIVDNPLASPVKTFATVPGLDVQNIGFLGKTVIGSSTGALSMQSLTSVPQSAQSATAKVLPAVIPVTLASLIRNLPVNSGMSPLVSLASAPIALSSASTGPSPSTSLAEVAASPLLTSKLQPSPGANFLLTTPAKTDSGASLLLPSPIKTEPGSLTAMPLTSNNARIATLLAAPSTHLNSNVIKPITSITNTVPASLHAATSIPTSSTTISIPDTLKTVTLTPTLLPLSLTNGHFVTSSSTPISQGTPLRIITPISHNSMVAAAAPLTNGQTPLMPTVVQLGASGQVALLQNLIPAQHLQMQSPHHLLAQPFVVMTSQGAKLTAASGVASGTVTTVASSTSVL